MNIDQSAMFYILIDSIQQALQTKGKPFSNFEFVFELFAVTPKNIRTNREAWILIKMQCVIFQWIRLNMLYKLMIFFFKFRNHFLN